MPNSEGQLNIEVISGIPSELFDSQERMQELAHVQRNLGLELSAVLELGEALELCLENALRISGMDSGGVYLIEDESGALELAFHRGLPPAFVETSSCYEADSSHTKLVMEGQPIYGEHLQLGVPVDEIRQREALRAIAVLPVQHEGKVIGCLNVASHTLNEVPPYARTALETLTAQMGSAIARVQAEDALRISLHNLRALLNTLEDFLFILDVDGDIIRANPAVSEQLGYSVEELYGMNVLDVHPPERREDAERIISRMLACEEEFCLIPLLTKDGKQIPVETKVTRGKWGGEGVLFGISRDITERKRAEKALQEAHDKLEARVQERTADLARANEELRSEIAARKHLEEMLEAEKRRLFDVLRGANLGTWEWNVQTGEMIFNERWAEIMGYTLEELTPLSIATWNKLVHPDDLKRSTELLERYFSGELDHYECEVRMRHRDGSWVWVLDIGKVSSWTENGESLLMSGTHQDITERKRAEKALQESERKYRSLIEQSSDAIYLLYGNKFEVINPRFEELFGITAEEARSPGFDFMDFVAPESKPQVKERMRKLRGGDDLGLRYEFTALNSEGKEIEVEVSVSYVPYRGGTATQGILRDITKRKRMEKERERLLAQIKRQANLMEQVLATVPEGVLLLDAERRIRQANPVAEANLAALTGAEAGDVITHLGARPLDELLTSPPTRGLWHEVQCEGRIFEVIARPMASGSELENWVLVMRDVTQEREVQARVRQQERLASVGQLAAGVAHDFNNIMSTIALYAQMMAQDEDELSPRCQDQLATIDQQAQQAVELIQQILDFSRRAVLERRPLDLVPLMKEQVKMLERTLPENIQIKFNYGRGELTVNADPTRLQQVMMNLAVNARDAMPEGGKLRFELERVIIGPEEEPPLPEMEPGEWVRITAADNGEGIPVDALPHIFDPFFTTKEVDEGTGLGLAQVWGIVKQHEGHIDVSTTVGAGTTFTLYLPALMTAESRLRFSEMAFLNRPPVIRGERELILLVEDDDSLRYAMVRIMNQLGYRVLGAENGLEALDIMERRGEEIALVLSDMVMPKMGGEALLHALREQGSSVPIVLLTGHPLEEELEGLLEKGLDDWLLKPPSLGELSEVMSRALGR